MSQQDLDLGAAVEMDMDDYASFESSNSGGGGSKVFLESWRDPDNKEDRFVDIWLHPKSTIPRFNTHVWPRIYKAREGEKIGVGRFNSMEQWAGTAREPKWLRNWHTDDGRFETPAQICPFGKTLDWVANMVADGKIGWLDPIFEFVVNDGKTAKDRKTIYAGGFAGLFNDKKLMDKEKENLLFDRLGITSKNAFMHDYRSQLRVGFTVVEDGKEANGIRLALEGGGLHEAQRDCINAMKKAAAASATRRAEQAGRPQAEQTQAALEAMRSVDPFKKPVCFRWQHLPSEQASKRYLVTAMDYDLTEPLKELFAQDPPNYREFIGQSNIAVLRESFEKHWCHAVRPDWGAIFGAAEKLLKGTKHVELPSDFNHGANEAADVPSEPAAATAAPAPSNVGRGEGRGARAESPKSAEPAAPAPNASAAAATDDDIVACDVCNGEMPSTALVCPHCKREYEYVDGNYRLKPEAVQGTTVRRAARKRSEMPAR